MLGERHAALRAPISACSIATTARHSHTAAIYGVPPALTSIGSKQPHGLRPGTAPASIRNASSSSHIADLIEPDAYRNGDPNRRALVDVGGRDAACCVPMLKDERAGRQRHDLPPGGPAVHREADRAGATISPTQAVIAIENTRLLASCAKHRGLERVAAAADRDRRRAQGHQPLGVRSADRARHAGRIRRAPVRGGHGGDHAPEGDEYFRAGSYGFSPEFMELRKGHPDQAGTRDHYRTDFA